jgi:hypothetical protein
MLRLIAVVSQSPLWHVLSSTSDHPLGSPLGGLALGAPAARGSQGLSYRGSRALWLEPKYPPTWLLKMSARPSRAFFP